MLDKLRASASILWLFAGYSALSLVIGYFLGASNTPVIGVFLTAFLGLAGTIVASKFLLDFRDTQKNSSAFTGQALLLVSIGLIIGTFLGEFYRTTARPPNPAPIPWTVQTAPHSTQEALDWIAVSAKLQSLGYSEKVITDLYAIRIEERNTLEEIIAQEQQDHGFSTTEVYDTSEPFSSSLSDVEPGKESTRGPASVVE